MREFGNLGQFPKPDENIGSELASRTLMVGFSVKSNEALPTNQSKASSWPTRVLLGSCVLRQGLYVFGSAVQTLPEYQQLDFVIGSSRPQLAFQSRLPLQTKTFPETTALSPQNDSPDYFQKP
jgi:hypothetical protein